MDLSKLSNDELLGLYRKVSEEQEFEENQADVKKILINSFYGSGSLETNPFSSGKLTNASITIAGRCMNKMTGVSINNWINLTLGKESNLAISDIIQADTDSNYLSLDRLIPTNIPTEEALPKVQKIVSDFIEPNIVRNIKGYCELFNVRDPQVLAAENEVIAKGFVSVASKRYYTRVLVKDNTVLGKPKIKVTGISLKGKSTPELAKVKLEPILDIILDKDENTLKQYIKDTQVAFYEAPISAIARKVKVNSLDYSRVEDKFKKYDGAKFLTAPINSHASLIYNEYIVKNNLQAQFNPIEASDSISYIYLNEPNNFGSKSVAFKDNKFTDIIPSRYVDRLTHFEKDFKSKIRIITDAIKWNIDTTTGSLDDW